MVPAKGTCREPKETEGTCGIAGGSMETFQNRPWRYLQRYHGKIHKKMQRRDFYEISNHHEQALWYWGQYDSR